jgi:hypothetical protein
MKPNRANRGGEELVRMDRIAGHVRARGIVLFNESFAATNEREGSEIASQIVSALLERDIMVLFVSHMYEFARSFLGREDVLFLRADVATAGQGATGSGKPNPCRRAMGRICTVRYLRILPSARPRTESCGPWIRYRYSRDS